MNNRVDGFAKTYFEDVGDFNRKFGLPTADDVRPQALPPDVLAFRAGFLMEELAEYLEACGLPEVGGSLRTMARALKDHLVARTPLDWPVCDLKGAADALADLVYVALGTAHFHGFPFDDVWAEVQRANMVKERRGGGVDPRSKRGHAFDVVKPDGWRPPDHSAALAEAFRRFRSVT